MNVADLIATLRMDASQFTRTAQQVSGQVGAVQKSMSGVGSAIRTAFGVVSVGLIAKFGQMMWDQGVQSEAFGRKYRAVFGENTAALDQWVTEHHSAFGVAEDEVQGYLAQIGNLLVGMGNTTEQAGQQAQKILDLAGAWSAWSGGQIGVQDASDKLVKGMMGQTRGLIELGLKVTEQEVSARMAAQGLSELTGAEASRAQQQVMFQLIQEKSTTAIGAYEEALGGAYGAQQDMAAALDEFKDRLGEVVVSAAPLVEVLAQLGSIPVLPTSLIGLLIGARFGPIGAVIGTVVGVTVAGISEMSEEGMEAIQRQIAAFAAFRARMKAIAQVAIVPVFGHAAPDTSWVRRMIGDIQADIREARPGLIGMNDLLGLLIPNRQQTQEGVSGFLSEVGYALQHPAYTLNRMFGTSFFTQFTRQGRAAMQQAGIDLHNAFLAGLTPKPAEIVDAFSVVPEAIEGMDLDTMLRNLIDRQTFEQDWADLMATAGEYGLDALIGQFDDLTPEMRATILKYADDISRLLQLNATLNLPVVPTKYSYYGSYMDYTPVSAQTPEGSGGQLGGKALGGPVFPYQSYLVGEKGPELFTPQTPGTIVPHSQTERMIAHPTGSTTVNVHVAGSVIAEKDLARIVEDQLIRAYRRGATSEVY